MIFRIAILTGLLLFQFLTLSYCAKLKIGILCKNKKLASILKEKIIENNFIITDNLNKADILICGSEEFIKKCCKINKKIIAINFNYYKISEIKDNHIIAYFPENLKIEKILNFLKNTLNKKLNFCILTHFKNIKPAKFLNVFYVDRIGKVPYILNKALKQCDFFINIKDELVFNYFSSGFLLKRMIVNGKFFTCFNKKMLDYGALFSFIINLDKFSDKIINFLKNYNIKKEKKTKIFFPDINDFFIYKNEKLYSFLKNESKK